MYVQHLVRNLPNDLKNLEVCWSGDTWRSFPQPQIGGKVRTRPVEDLPGDPIARALPRHQRRGNNDQGITRNVYESLDLPRTVAMLKRETALKEWQVRNALSALVEKSLVEVLPQRADGQRFYRRAA